MKKSFEAADIEVIAFEKADIVTQSPNIPGQGGSED